MFLSIPAFSVAKGSTKQMVESDKTTAVLSTRVWLNLPGFERQQRLGQHRLTQRRLGVRPSRESVRNNPKMGGADFRGRKTNRANAVPQRESFHCPLGWWPPTLRHVVTWLVPWQTTLRVRRASQHVSSKQLVQAELRG